MGLGEDTEGHTLSSPVWQGRPTCPGFIQEPHSPSQARPSPWETSNVTATSGEKQKHKRNTKAQLLQSAWCPGSPIFWLLSRPRGGSRPGLRLEGRNRAQGCPGSRPSCGPERGRQTQQKHCFGMKAHGADRRPHQPTSRGAQRARSEPLGGPDHRQSQDGGVDPQPCSPGRGGTRTQGRGHRLSLAPPQGRAILVKRGPQSKDAPCWFRALPPCGSATWRGHPAPQSGRWAMGRRLFGSPGGDLASTPGCHVLTPSSWQHHTAEASPSQGRVGGRGGSRSARPPTRIAGTCVRNLTPLLALSLEKISLYINISRDHKRPTEPEGTLQALLMVVCSEVRPSGRLGAGRQQGWHSEALRGHGLDPSRLNKRTWNEQRLLGLRDGHGHPGSARDGSPGRRPPAQDALRGLLAL